LIEIRTCSQQNGSELRATSLSSLMESESVAEKSSVWRLVGSACKLNSVYYSERSFIKLLHETVQVNWPF